MALKAKKKGLSRRTRDTLEAYLLIAGNYLVYAVFVLLPLIFTLYYSFTNYDLYQQCDFVGLENYINLLTDKVFQIALLNTCLYSVFVVSVPLAVGLLIAVLLNSWVYAKGLCRVLYYIPYLCSMISAALVWLWIFDPAHGFLNQFLKLFGLTPQRWLFDLKYALASLTVMGIWKILGYVIVIYLSGLQNIPHELYEAAEIDGAGEVRKFWKITVPMLTPTTFFVFVMLVIQSFNAFDQIKVMTDGGPMNATTTVVHQIYQRAFMFYDMGSASAMTAILVVITATLSLLNFRYGNQGADISL